MNQYSALGVDPEFGKGNEEIDREIGDPKHKPNPCLGPVEKAPFYAIKIYPGDGSTTVGLKIDEHCRVLDAQGDPLPDRKGVVVGKRVSVRVGLGGSRISKKNKPSNVGMRISY